MAYADNPEKKKEASNMLTILRKRDRLRNCLMEIMQKNVKMNLKKSIVSTEKK